MNLATATAISLLIVANLTACASQGLLGTDSDPSAHRFSMGGESYVVRQITEGTWTVGSAANLRILDSSPASTTALRQAVEAASGCKVTDSDFSMQGRQFDAQVKCPGTLVR